jgi:hypothetical protein
MTKTNFRALCAELLQECQYLHDNNRCNKALWDRAHAALAQPVPVSERPWEREDWCDAEGRCWMGDPGDAEFIPSWRLCRPEDAPSMTCSLPYWALPVPTADNTINQEDCDRG